MSYVLIVDDDEDDRDILREVLNQLNPLITCVQAHNGEEALRGLRSFRFPKPDLIFLDLSMPRINGIECLIELKEDMLLRSIPVVVCTTSRQARERDVVLKLGAINFVTKPHSFQEFCREIKSILTAQDLLNKGTGELSG